jgi:sugar lactone lactonase YvrE
MAAPLAPTSAPACVWDAGALLGEGPAWDARDASVYWVDIKGRLIHRYRPADGDRCSWTVPEMIGCLIPEAEGGAFIAALQSGFARLTLSNSGEAHLDPIADPEPDRPGNRFNDGKRAPDGSVWAGTMDDAEIDASGSWWRLDAEGGVTSLDTGFKVTNGPAFDAAEGQVYLTDSARQIIYRAPLIDQGAGLGEKSVFAQFSPEQGYPDGMTVGPDRRLWVAFWDGGCVRRLSLDGLIEDEIAMPVARPTSIAFNGSGTEAYITSASIGLDGAPLAGGLFRLTLQSR